MGTDDSFGVGGRFFHLFQNFHLFQKFGGAYFGTPIYPRTRTTHILKKYETLKNLTSPILRLPYIQELELSEMGFKSKATKANKAKKQERKPIQRKMEGQVWKIRTDLRPSNEVGKGGLCQYHFPGNERDPDASRTEIQEKELQFIKDKINGSWGFRR